MMRDSIRNLAPALSGLEQSVIAALAEGLQSKEIAVAINRSKPTVEGYIRLLYVKFNARSRAHLVACAYRCGLLDE